MNSTERGQQGISGNRVTGSAEVPRKAESNPGGCDRPPGSLAVPLMPRPEVEALMAKQAYWQSTPGRCRCGSGLDTYLCTTCWPQ